jgi:hypothetical protein
MPRPRFVEIEDTDTEIETYTRTHNEPTPPQNNIRKEQDEIENNGSTPWQTENRFLPLRPPLPPPALPAPEERSKKNKKKRARTNEHRDDADTLSLSDTLDFGTLPAPNEWRAK